MYSHNFPKSCVRYRLKNLYIQYNAVMPSSTAVEWVFSEGKDIIKIQNSWVKWRSFWDADLVSFSKQMVALDLDLSIFSLKITYFTPFNDSMTIKLNYLQKVSYLVAVTRYF